jgi:hypothetical protein
VIDTNIFISFQALEEIKKLWKLFQSADALQMEVNPFVETDKGDVISVDAKLQFDDNARFRQASIFSLEDVSETDPREVEAARAKLNYVQMSGNIGCLGKSTAVCATFKVLRFYLFVHLIIANSSYLSRRFQDLDPCSGFPVKKILLFSAYLIQCLCSPLNNFQPCYYLTYNFMYYLFSDFDIHCVMGITKVPE